MTPHAVVDGSFRIAFSPISNWDEFVAKAATLGTVKANDPVKRTVTIVFDPSKINVLPAAQP